MTDAIFLHRIETNLIDTGLMNKLDDSDWCKRATGCSSFIVAHRQDLLDVARTALAETNMVDK